MPNDTGNPLARYTEKHGDLTQRGPIEQLINDYEAASVSTEAALNELRIAVAPENRSHADIARKKGFLATQVNELEALHEVQLRAMQSWLERVGVRKDDVRGNSMEERSTAAKDHILAIKNEGEKLWEKANAQHSHQATRNPLDRSTEMTQPTQASNAASARSAGLYAFATRLRQQAVSGQPHQPTNIAPPAGVSNAAAVQSAGLYDFATRLRQQAANRLPQSKEMPPPPRVNNPAGVSRPAPNAGPSR